MAPKRAHNAQAQTQELTYVSGETGAWNLDVTRDEFAGILRARATDSVLLARSKFFRVTCGDSVMEVTDNGKECKVYTDVVANTWRAAPDLDRLMFVERKRMRRPYHTFPSTTDIYEAAWVERSVFKCGQGIHITFEEVTPAIASQQARYFRVFCTSSGEPRSWVYQAALP